VPTFETKDFETKDYFLKNYILVLSSRKGLLVQAPPLNFLVHLHKPGNFVLMKTWKENKLEPAWEGPFMVLLARYTAVWTMKWWTYHTWVKKVPPPDQKE
jgi:hypothetical protein